MDSNLRTTQKAFSDLKDMIHKVKRRRIYSKTFENEVRTIFDRFHIIVTQTQSLSSFYNAQFPDRMPMDWYNQKGGKYFADEDFDSDDSYYTDDDDFLKFLFQELKNELEKCELVVKNALYELEQLRQKQVQSLPNARPTGRIPKKAQPKLIFPTRERQDLAPEKKVEQNIQEGI
ncbi:MAG: hypothetical protein ACFFFG_01505 [Candidatus Thorarchaeota archaeon]